MKIALLIMLLSFNAFALEFQNARVRLLPPSTPATGVFVDIINPHDFDVTLVKAKSSRAKRVELHTHIKENGMMMMREVPKIIIPAKGSTQLKPGSFHIMLIGLTKPLKLNEEIPIM